VTTLAHLRLRLTLRPMPVLSSGRRQPTQLLSALRTRGIRASIRVLRRGHHMPSVQPCVCRALLPPAGSTSAAAVMLLLLLLLLLGLVVLRLAIRGYHLLGQLNISNGKFGTLINMILSMNMMISTIKMNIVSIMGL
jgi:hypothetical protein